MEVIANFMGPWGPLVPGFLGGVLAAFVVFGGLSLRTWSTNRARKIEIDTLTTELDALREAFKRFQNREGMRAVRDEAQRAKSAQSEAQAILADAAKNPPAPGKKLPFPFNVAKTRGVGH